MEANDIRALVLKYNEGVADPSEIRQLEQLIEDGSVELSELRDLKKFEEQLFTTEGPSPSLALDDQFYTMLAAEKRTISKPRLAFRFPELSFLMPRLAFTIAILTCGFIGGYLLKKPAPPDAIVKDLSDQVGALKEMVMLSLLEKESASERLRAVSLTSEMDQASHKVTAALIETLNKDANVNVRLAALDALRPYVRDNTVRASLVMSIGQQDSPLVQVALAELMRDIQEKRSVKEFNKILKGDKTPQEVKNRIRKNIQVLI